MSYSNENPAARLLNIFQRVDSGTPRNATTRSVLAFVLNTDVKDTAEFHRKLAFLLQQASEINESVGQSKKRHVTKATDQISAAMERILHNAITNENWSRTSDIIDSHFITYLELLADHIEYVSQNNLSPENLESVRSSIDNALKSLIEAEDIPAEMRQYLSSQLHKIKRHIDDYFITGIKPAIEALEATFGHTLLNEKYRTALKEGDSTINQVLKHLAEVAAIVSAATGIVAISSSPVAQALIEGSPK